MGSETPRGFYHGPAMGAGVSTTNNFAFEHFGIYDRDKHVYLLLTRASTIQPLSA